jgi:hypothetical protein
MQGKENNSVGTLGLNDEVTDLTIHVAADSTYYWFTPARDKIISRVEDR